VRTTRLVGVVLGALLFAVAGSGAPAPKSIVKETGPIRGFARDGTQIAWAAYHPRARCFSSVRHRNLGRGAPRSLVSPRGFTCRHEVGFQFPGEIKFAVAGTQALWVLSESGNDVYDHLLLGTVGRPDRELLEFTYSATYDGDRLAGVDGSGKTLVYGWYRVVVTNDSCGDGGECLLAVSGGSVRRVVGRRSVDVPGAPPALRVATNGELVALVKAQGEANRFGYPYDKRNVEVRAADSGTLVSSFRAGRNVLDLALGDEVVAVLLGGRPLRIVRRDARTGAVLGSTAVPGETVSIDADGKWLALAALGEIHVLDLTTGRLNRLWVTRGRPLGLSVSNGRVSWVENVRRKGFVSSIAIR
jgi:hypothetical protein